jgi:selenide,water dikinase
MYAVRRLFCGGRILPGHSASVAAAMRRQAAAQGVSLHEGSPVAEVQAGQLRTGDGAWHSFDEALWCTQAAAAGWLRDTGLPVGTFTRLKSV